MKLKKFITVVAMTAMVGTLAVGCGKSDSKDNGSDKKSESSWDSSNDITILSREDGSGTRGAFIELFGIEEEKNGEKVDMTTDEAQITNSTSVMMTTVAGDDYSCLLYTSQRFMTVILIRRSICRSDRKQRLWTW